MKVSDFSKKGRLKANGYCQGSINFYAWMMLTLKILQQTVNLNNRLLVNIKN